MGEGGGVRWRLNPPPYLFFSAPEFFYSPPVHRLKNINLVDNHWFPGFYCFHTMTRVTLGINNTGLGANLLAYMEN